MVVERNMKKKCKGTIILTSKGLNSKTGNKIIWKKSDVYLEKK